MHDPHFPASLVHSCRSECISNMCSRCRYCTMPHQFVERLGFWISHATKCVLYEYDLSPGLGYSCKMYVDLHRPAWCCRLWHQLMANLGLFIYWAMIWIFCKSLFLPSLINSCRKHCILTLHWSALYCMMPLLCFRGLRLWMSQSDVAHTAFDYANTFRSLALDSILGVISSSWCL